MGLLTAVLAYACHRYRHHLRHYLPWPEEYHGLLALILALLVTELGMLITTKHVMTVTPLPLLLCQAQFLVSTMTARWLQSSSSWMTITTAKENHTTTTSITPWPSLRSVLPLSLAWTLGFVLFNASASAMSPALVNVIRCGEPLATALVGRLGFGKRYSRQVLVTLIPVVGGVLVASALRRTTTSSRSSMTFNGMVWAGLSNVCFCLRPFFLQRLQQQQNAKKASPMDNTATATAVNGHHQNKNNNTDLQKLIIFRQVTQVAAFAILPPLVWILEGSKIRAQDWTTNHYHRHYLHHPEQPTTADLSYWINVVLSCLTFFAYQYTQLRIMTLVSPLAFSILTPIIKAIMIGLCSWYFGDAFGLPQGLGVLVTSAGGYWFTSTVRNQQLLQPKRQPKQPSASATRMMVPVHVT